LEESKPQAAVEGKRLFANLGCVGCHIAPDVKDPVMDTPRPRNPLAHVPEKYYKPALIEFLKKPEQHYQWSKMPNFRLSDTEAEQLASYLMRATDAHDVAVNGDAKRGQELFQTSGCISCHGAKVENKLKPKSLAELSDMARGCMAADAAQRGSAPDFYLSDDDRAAIAAVAKEKFASLKQDTPAEFAERQVVTLNCVACHVRDRQDDLLTSTLKEELTNFAKDLPPEDKSVEDLYPGDQQRPQLTWVGEKLRPQWAAQFIAGQVPYKPRPWLRARMPGFPARAEALAEGLAASHGVPATAPPNAQPDAKLAETGRKLVARQGGFACVQCHGVGEMKAISPFEAPAINFAHVSDRLTHEYYDRWVYNPQRVLPGTRMPSFADNKGATALKDILNGDARQQFDAIWNYLLQGKDIRPPE
jgi:mono/diheme cytochrome c family protein